MRHPSPAARAIRSNPGVLALTSNNWSVRQLGAKRWKLLHRLAYVAAAILIYHQTIAGKGHWYIAAGFSFLSWRCKVRG